MTGSGSLGLPPGWQAATTARGVDLRVVSSGRPYISAVAGILAILAGARMLAHWNRGSAESAIPWLLLTALLAALALWCAIGDEVWRLERNCIIHRIGIMGCGYSRRFQNAELEIMLRFSTRFGKPFCRLYVVEQGERHFLMERGLRELQQLAEFISAYTGWQVHSNDGTRPSAARALGARLEES